MDFSGDSSRAALLLTNRLVSLDAKPLTARELWELVGRVDPAELLHAHPSEIAARAGVDAATAARYRVLLDAATALSFEQERLADGGVSLVSALDAAFPAVLRDRLGSACPPFLLVAGPAAWLGQQALGVVGARDADDQALAVARNAAERGAAAGWTVVSGLARGVDRAAMAGALDTGGRVIGVPAEGILRAAREAGIRRRVHTGELCLASPYAPNVTFQAGTAMGRNKIVYALSTLAFVVASAKGSGGTWGGATEALDRRYAPVAVWTGPGAQEGNAALLRLGAAPVDDVSRLLEVDPTRPARPTQASLF